MDIQKEREAFECWFRTTTTYKTLWDFISTHQTNIKSVFVKRNGKTYQNDCVQIAWEAWQAAKAQAVPEGFVLVPMVPSERMINAVRHCYEGEAYLPYSLYSEFVNQAIIERMEAQEPTND